MSIMEDALIQCLNTTLWHVSALSETQIGLMVETLSTHPEID